MAHKSPDAFRTISEVADWLETPAHVLRFWESKFTQVKPIKRAGGRRYYRPADMELLGGIKKLLHDEGMTIKGVQKVLRQQGVKYVSGLSEPVSLDDTASVTETEAHPPVAQPEATPAVTEAVVPAQAPLPPLPETIRTPLAEVQETNAQGNLFGDGFEEEEEIELLEVEVEDEPAPPPAEVIPLRRAPAPIEAAEPQPEPESAPAIPENISAAAVPTPAEPAPRILAMVLQSPEKHLAALQNMAPQIRALHARLSQTK
ncbi:MerR family transcriptional regulator [Donghicola mangrovi]|uniref:MerR family transcriptional regulator n=1 Tax=Donghicola mangrovi TaxID=2729614 RepID=UPI001D141761|nr:MerR family transcriptional regulator [Donghicola mangrovi]